MGRQSWGQPGVPPEAGLVLIFVREQPEGTSRVLSSCLVSLSCGCQPMLTVKPGPDQALQLLLPVWEQGEGDG